jgi:hypothetical protein
MQYRRDIFLELKFLILIQALEGYHRKYQGQQVSLEKCLGDLLSRLPNTLQQLVTEDSDSFINMLVITRHYYAHRDEGKQSRALKGEDLYWIIMHLNLWIYILVLMELNIPEDLINDGLRRNKKYNYLIRQKPGAG